MTPEQRSTYQAELGAAGKAPNSASTFETTSGYQDAAGKVQSAVDQANLWNSGNNPANISAALAPYEGPNATQGVRTLDSLLLSQTPGAYNQIKAAVAPAAGFQDQLATGTQNANSALQAAIANDLGATSGATGAAQTYAKNLTDYLSQQVGTNQAAADSQNVLRNQIIADLAGGHITSADAAALGISQPQSDSFAANLNTYNDSVAGNNQFQRNPQTYTQQTPINLSTYFNPAQTINSSTVATPQNYSDVAALQALLGQNSPVNLPISPDTSAQAGTGASNPSLINSGPLQNDLASYLAAAQAIPFENVGTLGSGPGDQVYELNNLLSILNPSYTPQPWKYATQYPAPPTDATGAVIPQTYRTI